MKPSRPYHAVTAYHREPGGLRRLDFFVDRIETWKMEDGRSKMESRIRILDVGCGKGNIALPLASLGYEVTGVDYDAPSITSAREAATELSIDAEFLEGSLERVAGRTFDVIIASEVLEHQKNPRAFLQSLKAILSKDGILLLSVPNGKSLEERIRRFTTHTDVGKSVKRSIKSKLGHESVQSAASHPHEQFFSLRALRDTLYGAGWNVEAMAGAAAFFKEFFYLLGRVFMRRGSAAFHRLDRFDGWLAARLPLSWADGWLIESRPFDAARPLVLHVVTTLEAGGAERLVHDLASRLPGRGYRTHVVSLFGGGSLEPAFRRDGVDLTIVGGHSWANAYRTLCAIIERDRPLIVHTHLFGADVIGRVAARLHRVPTIVSTEHNVNLDHGPVKRFVKRCLVPMTSAFVAVSKEVKQFMVATEGIPADRIRVIQNGIDMSRVEPRSPGAFHDIPRLITVGRLTTQKDHATLFNALSFVKRPWKLDVVGVGECEAELRRLADRLGIASRVHWLGFREDVPHLLAQSDLFCFPSKWEGLGLAFLEAAAAAVPIVASDLTVFREILSPNQTSYVPVANVAAWSRAIERLIDDPLPAVRSAYEAALDIQQRFSVDKMVASYANLYTSLRGTKQSPAGREVASSKTPRNDVKGQSSHPHV